MWVGWLEEYPDYRTQGTTIDELKENLIDIYANVGGSVVAVKKKQYLDKLVQELQVHQVELEAQSDELHRVRAELEANLDISRAARLGTAAP